MEITFPRQAAELTALLKADQEEYRAFSRKYYWGENNQNDKAAKAKAAFRAHVRVRATRMLEILEEVGEPSIASIGEKAARAMSILAAHSSRQHSQSPCHIQCVLCAKSQGYVYMAIPSMTAWALLLEQKPQQFGTIWLFESLLRHSYLDQQLSGPLVHAHQT